MWGPLTLFPGLVVFCFLFFCKWRLGWAGQLDDWATWASGQDHSGMSTAAADPIFRQS